MKRLPFLLLLLFLSLLLLSGCGAGGGTNPAADPREGFTEPDAADYRTLTWSTAFKEGHAKLSREYGFSQWKGVDWDALYSSYLPRIEQAEAAHDQKAYYLALHEYISSIPDGHVSLTAADQGVAESASRELTGGGYGLALAELDDWRVIAATVAANSPAAQAGIVPGAEIVTWGGVSPRMAIGRINVGALPYKALLGSKASSIATGELYRLEQARLLVRAAVGSSTRVEFRNPDTAQMQSFVLVAVEDAGASFSLLNFAVRQTSDQVDYRILPEGYGYLQVRGEADLSNVILYPDRIFQQIQTAITAFVGAGVPGVIVDLRGNFGGSDQLAADLCGFFYPSEQFYEYLEMFDKRNGMFLRLGDISITPQTPYYGDVVVVLVNPGTVSSGEGPAKFLSKRPNGRVIGFHGTNGSFGLAGGEIALPGGYTIKYPFGRSVDQYGIIQLDSRNGIGGVQPNLRVPKSYDTVMSFTQGNDVELQYAVDYLNANRM